MKYSKKKTFFETGKSLINAIQSLNQLIPYVVPIIVFLFAGLIILAVIFTKLMMGIVILLVFIVAILIYLKTNNFGEAALALVAGLLAAFTVEWTAKEFIVFSSVWLVFAMLVMIISSVKIASQVESIYRQASLAIDSNNYQKIEMQLKTVSSRTPLGLLGPIERAESVLILSFRRIPPSFFGKMLPLIEQLQVISKEDHKTVSLFIADLFKSIEYKPHSDPGTVITNVVSIIKNVPTSPQEVFKAFNKTRHYLLSKAINVEKYFNILNTALSLGISQENLNNYFDENV